MTGFPSANSAASEYSARLLYTLYTALSQEFMIELPSCSDLETSEEASPESLAEARSWFQNADQRIAVHQLRQFFQTSNLVGPEGLRAVLEHHLHKAAHEESDRDKIDFLLVQFLSSSAPPSLKDDEVTPEFVARMLEPVLGEAEATVPPTLEPLEELVEAANACHGLREVFSSGVLEKGRTLKIASGDDYFLPAFMAAFTRFNFLMRRVFFRRMQDDLNAVLDGLRELEKRGVEHLDCRRVDFSAEEPVDRLRMICQSWKVMFQAEYAFGQPLRILVDLRDVVETALQVKSAGPAGQPASSESRARGAAASGNTADADHAEPGAGSES